MNSEQRLLIVSNRLPITTEMVNGDTPVLAVTTCGDWNAAINAYLGLPTLGNGVMQATILDGNGDPIQLA